MIFLYLILLPSILALLSPPVVEIRSFQTHRPDRTTNPFLVYNTYTSLTLSALAEESPASDKVAFLNSLDRDDTLNLATKGRTSLLSKLIADKVIVSKADWSDISANDLTRKDGSSLANAGSRESFQLVAPGRWKVIYAPHMTTMAGLARGKFDVQYTLHEDGSMESHARYEFPIIGKGFLSVSGTYGSVDDNVCRVDFDRFWVKVLKDGERDEPYSTFEKAPKGLIENFINRVGGSFFLEQVSTFPVSFLDDDMIVFDFELLGTRITGRKI